MTDRAAPRALLVTSMGASPAAVTPVLAALEASGLKVRAIDVGRVGSRSDGAIDRMVRAIVGELAERRLERELGSYPPDVVLAFDPGSTTVLTLARDSASKPAPVLAVIDALAPESEWATTDADRFLVVDDEAAYELGEHGVDGERILPVGAVCEAAFAAASKESRSSLRARFKVGSDRPVVLVEVAGLGYDTTSQIALQLSLCDRPATYLFDAGNDSEAATALRRQVPTLGIRAKLFGDTEDAALFWRCADVIVSRPRPQSVARTLVLGARMVSFLPEDKSGQELAKALEERGIGVAAANALLLSSALDPLVQKAARTDSLVGEDGAANVADIAWVVGAERGAVVEERRAAEREFTRERVRAATSAADAVARSTAAAGGLEDLSGATVAPAADGDLPDPGEIARLKAEVSARLGQVSKTVFEASNAAEQWQKRQQKAAARGNSKLAQDAERNGDAERARMHQALAEMAQLESELKGLERAAAVAAQAGPRRASSSSRPEPEAATSAPPRSAAPKKQSVDDLLAQMKAGQRGGTSTNAPPREKRRGKGKRGNENSSVDEELAALKRKMAAKKKGRK